MSKRNRLRCVEWYRKSDFPYTYPDGDDLDRLSRVVALGIGFTDWRYWPSEGRARDRMHNDRG